MSRQFATRSASDVGTGFCCLVDFDGHSSGLGGSLSCLSQKIAELSRKKAVLRPNSIRGQFGSPEPEEQANLPIADAGVAVSRIAPSLDVVAYVNIETRPNRNESVWVFMVDPWVVVEAIVSESMLLAFDRSEMNSSFDAGAFLLELGAFVLVAVVFVLVERLLVVGGF